MNSLNLFTIVIAIISLAIVPEIFGQKKGNSFDNEDVDAILSNQRLVQHYLKCLLDKGPCPQAGRDLKTALPKALATDCAECTPTQRQNSMKIINYLRANKAQDWHKLLAKYDPKGLYLSRHKELA